MTIVFHSGRDERGVGDLRVRDENMRVCTIFPAILLLLIEIFGAGCAHTTGSFLLTGRVMPPTRGADSPTLNIRLRNTSPDVVSIVMLTNLFEGNVYLRDSRGEVHEFMDTNYWFMSIVAFWFPQTAHLKPGAELKFATPLAHFICPDQMEVTDSSVGYPIRFVTLDKQYRAGCVLWCTLDASHSKRLADGRFTDRATVTLVTDQLRYDTSGNKSPERNSDSALLRRHRSAFR
jgi:hypothetical protein